MLKRLFPLLLLVLVFTLWRAAAYTAPTNGKVALFAPLVQKQSPATLPNEPLLLVAQDNPDKQLVWYNADGTYRNQITTSESNEFARISPDGTRIVFHQRRSDNSLHSMLISAEGGTPTEITAIPSGQIASAWSPEGRYIAYGHSGQLNTYEVGTGITATLSLAYESFEYISNRWHPETLQAYYYHWGSSTFIQNSIYRINGDGTERQLVFETENTDYLERILSDGRLVVSTSATDHFDLALLNSDGSDYGLLRTWSRPYVEVSISPVATGLLYEEAGTLYWEDFAGQPIGEFTPPCAEPYDSCFLGHVEWQAGGNALVLEWNQQDQQGSDAQYLLYTLTLDGSQPHLLDTQATLLNPTYSPDGAYLAYETGGNVVIWDTIAQTVATTLAAPVSGDTKIVGWRPTP
jgi:Tol biopolymer transport system component